MSVFGDVIWADKRAWIVEGMCTNKPWHSVKPGGGEVESLDRGDLEKFADFHWLIHNGMLITDNFHNTKYYHTPPNTHPALAPADTDDSPPAPHGNHSITGTPFLILEPLGLGAVVKIGRETYVRTPNEKYPWVDGKHHCCTWSELLYFGEVEILSEGI